MQATTVPTHPLTEAQRLQFRDRGLLHLKGLLPHPLVQAAQDMLRRRLAPCGLWTGSGWNCAALPRPVWPANGLDTKSVIGNRHPELAALVTAPALVAAVDVLLEGDAYEPTGPNRRPQTLFTLPNSDQWTLPSGWHSDTPRLACGVSPGVQLFTFLDSVAPRGGGTMVVAGSHRLLDDGRTRRIADLTRDLRAHPFFARLLAHDAGPRPALPQADIVDGIPVEIVEITGAPGDAWLMDLRLLHAASPNAADRPRAMLTFRYERTRLQPDIARAHGWRVHGSRPASFSPSRKGRAPVRGRP